MTTSGSSSSNTAFFARVFAQLSVLLRCPSGRSSSGKSLRLSRTVESVQARNPSTVATRLTTPEHRPTWVSKVKCAWMYPKSG